MRSNRLWSLLLSNVSCFSSLFCFMQNIIMCALDCDIANNHLLLDHCAQLELKWSSLCVRCVERESQHTHLSTNWPTIIICSLFLCKFHAQAIVWGGDDNCHEIFTYSHLSLWPEHDDYYRSTAVVAVFVVILFTCSLISLTARNSFFSFILRFWNLHERESGRDKCGMSINNH